MDITKKQKQIIHILLKEYNVSDIIYRNFLYNTYDVTSCTYLTEKQADELIHKLKYIYSKDYKAGYDRGISMVMNTKDEDLLESLLKSQLCRELTECEKLMFKMLDEEQKKDFIKNFY